MLHVDRRRSIALQALLAVMIGCAGCGEKTDPASAPAIPSIAASDASGERGPEPEPEKEAVEDISRLLDGLESPSLRELSSALLLDTVELAHLDQLHSRVPSFESSSARWRLVRAIGKLRSPRSIDLLCSLARSDSSLYVRRNAVWGLGEIGDERAAATLISALDDADDSVRLHAARALFRVQGRGSEEVLRSAAERHADGGLPLAVAWLFDSENKGTRRASVEVGTVSRGVLEDTQYLVYVPHSYDPSIPSPLLVSVHGTNGVPEPYVEMCIQDAERYGTVVLAPFFDYPTFPNYDLLELNGPRSDVRLLDIIETLGEQLNIDAGRFLLFGHSKGGQFISRFVIAHPDRIRAAMASGAGNYVQPDPLAMFPGGTRFNPTAPDLNFDFSRLVETKLAVVVGSKELQRRIDEYERFKQATLDFAENEGIPCRVEFAVIPGIGHSGRDSYVRKSDFLFVGLQKR